MLLVVTRLLRSGASEVKKWPLLPESGMTRAGGGVGCAMVELVSAKGGEEPSGIGLTSKSFNLLLGCNELLDVETVFFWSLGVPLP